MVLREKRKQCNKICVIEQRGNGEKMEFNLNENPLAKVITPEKIDYEKEGLACLEDIIYAPNDREACRMDMVYPAGQQEKLPVVIWVHGGGWSDENLTRKYLPSRELAELSKRGYVTVSIDYRLTGKAPFPAQIEDCKSAVRFLRSHGQDYPVDVNRIGVWGESAGGHLAQLMAYSSDGEFDNGTNSGVSSAVQGVVAWYAPCDLRTNKEWPEDEEIYNRLFPEQDIRKQAELRKAASPVCYADRKNPPSLLMHGDVDRLVDYENSRLMCERLKEAGNDVELVTVPGQGHGFFEGEAYYGRIYAFFDRILKGSLS